MKKYNQYIEIAHTQDMNINTMGIRSCELIKSALLTVYKKVEISRVNNAVELSNLISKKPDLIFLGLKRLPRSAVLDDLNQKRRWVADQLDEEGINYTGSEHGALELGVYKHCAKTKVQEVGLPTAKFFVVKPGELLSSANLPLEFPLFVKPDNSGGSKGIDDDSVVRNFRELNCKIEYIFDKFGTDALVEQYLTGREFSVAILANGHGCLEVMPIEIVADKNSRGDRLLSQGIKKADTEQVMLVKEDSIRQQISKLAKDIFIALGARDFGRVDIRMDEAGRPYFLEANLIPGLSGGYFTRACKMNANLSYDEMIVRIAKLGLLHPKADYPRSNLAELESPASSVELEPSPS